MHIVTGAAGFIGSNLVRALNRRGIRDIVAVDDLHRGDKFQNLRDCAIADYLDHREFREAIRRGTPGLRPKVVYHQGACANTTESDGRYMMDNNFTFSKEVLHWALGHRAPFVYASSASVYGTSTVCREEPEFERPLNVYAYSKLLLDQYVRRLLDSAETTVVGLRYFNVYGPREAHKGKMASMVHQLAGQLRETGTASLFRGTDGCDDGEQRRDFVFVGDVVAVNQFFGEGPTRKGIFNLGTGRSRSFNEVARALIGELGRGEVRYIAFPESLRGKYQSHTEADLSRLRVAGCDHRFTPIEEGAKALCDAAGER